MEIDNIVKVTVGAAVVIIMIVAFAIPVMSGFTESSPGTSAENTPVETPTMSIFEVTEGTVFEIQDSTLSINGQPNELGNSMNLLSGNILICIQGGDVWFYIDGRLDGVTSGTLTVNNGIHGQVDCRFSDVTNIDTLAPTYLYVRAYNSEAQPPQPSWTEDSGLISVSNGAEINAYVNPNTEIIIADSNISAMDSVATGTYDNLVLVGSNQNSPTLTTAIDGEAINITGISWEGSTEFSVFIPQEYYTELPVKAQVSGAAATIIDILPLIMVVGIMVAVAGAAGLFILNRRS